MGREARFSGFEVSWRGRKNTSGQGRRRRQRRKRERGKVGERVRNWDRGMRGERERKEEEKGD